MKTLHLNQFMCFRVRQ
uniref:Uncharacterized protein n=1 Tax=Anguilla anguilla TaxID=7936 RepID=A0A0E9RXJ0_ANGAN